MFDILGLTTLQRLPNNIHSHLEGSRCPWWFNSQSYFSFIYYLLILLPWLMFIMTVTMKHAFLFLYWNTWCQTWILMNSRQVLEAWAMAAAQEGLSLSMSSVMSLICSQFSWKTGSVSLTHESGLDFDFSFLFFKWMRNERNDILLLPRRGRQSNYSFCFDPLRTTSQCAWTRPNVRSQGQKGHASPRSLSLEDLPYRIRNSEAGEDQQESCNANNSLLIHANGASHRNNWMGVHRQKPSDLITALGEKVKNRVRCTIQPNFS